ncbi:hypothetical protein THRCLA_01157 [Thraustotheca clavata]|uniref:Elongator complex protein 6 n=1 Tax=Thraustotheca clavata TaxID=74557 RepID=A0A1W0A947_9STRA|nr:hypothetical protein THRCLA_01157 [Thraustotheca clavata]
MSDGMAELGFKEVPLQEVIVVNDSVQANGNFLLHYFTTLALKAEMRVCMVALNNTLDQFVAVGRKMGVNVQNAVATQKWLHIDGVSRPYDWSAGPQTPMQFTMSTTPDAMKNDLQQLFLRLQTFIQASSVPCILVIDDLSILTYHYGLNAALMFARYCRQLALNAKSTLLVLHHGDVNMDSQGTFLNPAITDLASIVFTVRGLDTGYCKDIHGSVMLTRRYQPTSQSSSLHCSTTKKSLQYKLVENGIRCIHVETL